MPEPSGEASTMQLLGGPWAQRLLAQQPCQPDRRSCGATIQVIAVALLRDGYARHLLATQSTFRDEVLRMHRRTTSLVDVLGALQLPWPRALGTPPWAVARQLGGITGVSFGVNWTGRSVTAPAVQAISRGLPVALFTGTRWSPRHVALVVGADSARQTVALYDPAGGQIAEVSWEQLENRRLSWGWPKLWFAVTPNARSQ